MKQTPKQEHQTVLTLNSLVREVAEVRSAQERAEAQRLTRIRVSTPTVKPITVPVTLPLTFGYRVCAR